MNKVIKTFGKEPTEYKNNRYWNANLIEFDGNEYIVSQKAVLTLITIASCNASCKFCSNEITYTPNGRYLKYDETLKRTIDFAKLGGISKVAFSGGEPTANPQALYDLFHNVSQRFNKSRIHTNGFGLLKKITNHNHEEKILLDALIEEGLSGVSLSIAHDIDSINQNIMRFKGSWKGLTPDMIHEISSRRSEKFQVRMSCVLTLAGIKSVEEIIRYIEWGRQFNIKYFIFRSPSWIPGEFAKETSVSRFNRINHVDIDPITDQLDQMKDLFEIKFNEHKTDSHVHVYKYDNEVTVDIDASSEEADPDDKIRRLIVMPNNVAYKSWIDPLSNLFSEQKEVAQKDAIAELPNLIRTELNV